MTSFEHDIRPLFREQDARAMSFAFDLTSYDGVRSNAEAIYGRLSAGTMPCDGAWPEDRVRLFREWIDEGAPPYPSSARLGGAPDRVRPVALVHLREAVPLIQVYRGAVRRDAEADRPVPLRAGAREQRVHQLAAQAGGGVG